MASVDDLFAAAMSLPLSERLALVDRLFEALEHQTVEAELDDDFQHALSDRIEAFRRGETHAIDADEALDEVERSICLDPLDN
jgi:putative addiction module component (TIGR02574 family)